MKKILLIATYLLTLILLIGCQSNKIHQTHQVKTASVINLSTEFSLTTRYVDIYYLPNSFVPYIDLETFIDSLTGFLNPNAFELNKTSSEITLSSLDPTSQTVLSMVWDFSKHQVTLDHENFLYLILEEGETDYAVDLIDIESVSELGESITYSFKDYDIYFEIYNNKYLVPFSVANQLLTQTVYFDMYFNGDHVYAIETGNIDLTVAMRILDSSLNKKQIPKSITDFTYQYSAFLLDYFYGLKNDKNMSTGKDFIASLEADYQKNVGRGIFELIYKLDDLHSSHITRGYYDNVSKSTTYLSLKLSSNIKNFYNNMDHLAKEAALVYQDNLNTTSYYYLDNNQSTVSILLNEFDLDTPDILETALAQLPSSVKNVVVDLSLNTGGNLGSMLRIITRLTDNPIWYHYQNPLTGENSSFKVGNKKERYPFSFYIKTSRITYSAGNLMAAIALESNIPLIGEQSLGGAAAVSMHVMPDGSIITLSSLLVLSQIILDKYESIEHGIQPNYQLNSLYDAKEILSIINKNEPKSS